MTGVPQSRGHYCFASVMLLALGLLACGCSSNPPGSPEPASSGSSFSDRMKGLLSRTPVAGEQAGVSAQADCPGVDIRSGASTYSVGATPGAPATPASLRYQVVIAKTARECVARGGTMTIKVGVQGRIILGPAGGPGQVDVPLRLAVVQDGPEPKTIWTRFYRVPVVVPPCQTNVPFVQIEEDMSFPVPSAAELEAYVVFVGFDPASAKEQPQKKKPPKPAGAKN